MAFMPEIGVHPPGPPSPLLAAIFRALVAGHGAPPAGSGMVQVGGSPGGPMQAAGGSPYAPAPPGGTPYHPAPPVPIAPMPAPASGGIPMQPWPASMAPPRRAPFNHPRRPHFGTFE